ncbi:MAG: DNA-3-methyladenine glycosylase I [Desulfomonile tiedjei]|uniref:DNA-3-methyladenine glycosylase I n=1 Tax=Desulfomonile tiedjei TaxID=2358 RepID=A0A9D6V6Z2_9BACT|nr:DNA-3-methyladenine glycosylase I [Desulfomonile tiedjei]
MQIRCAWANASPLEKEYHDKEWGVPLHEDRLLFEFLVLEGAQAGLSWATILRKREGYRRAFKGFEPEIVASYDQSKVEELLGLQDIVRNRLKIEAAIRNARAFLKIRDEFGTFDTYIWGFVDGKQVRNAWKGISEVPTSTNASDAMSKDLKKRGFSFVGTTICYAFMQAVGIVNDHTVDCFRWREIDEEISHTGRSDNLPRDDK